MNDYDILIFFGAVAILFFYLSLKMSNETKMLIDLHAKKFKTNSYDEIREKMINNPLVSPYYAFRKTFSMLPMIFKKTKDPEVNVHAQRVRRYFYSIILLVVVLFIFLIVYGLISTR